jgi:hypothetical protein
MSNRKSTFAKRQRETDLKDHARAKEARLAARRAQRPEGSGPEVAWDPASPPPAPVYEVPLPPPTPSRSTDSAD